MGDLVKKIGADHFKKLRQQLLRRKKTFLDDQKFKFNINHVKPKPNVAKPFKRGPKLSIPYLDHKFPAHFRRNCQTYKQVGTPTVDSQEAVRRPKRKLETFVNLPSDFFCENNGSHDLFIIEPDIQITEVNHSLALANSTIFDPPVTSTPFGALVGDMQTVRPVNQEEINNSPPDAVEQTNNFGRNIRSEKNDQQKTELDAYKQFVEAIATIGSTADKHLFPDTLNEFQKAREYLQKVVKHTAPSPAPKTTPIVKKSFCIASPIPFEDPSPTTPMQQASSDFLFSPPEPPLLMFGQREPLPHPRNDTSQAVNPFLFETTNAFDIGRPAQIALDTNQEMTLFGTPAAVQVQQRHFNDTFEIPKEPSEALEIFGTPTSKALGDSIMDTFEETFDRNLSGYRKMITPYTPPNYTQLLNDETINILYKPRNMLDRRNQFVVRRQMPHNYN